MDDPTHRESIDHAYEMAREANIRENNSVLKASGLPELRAALSTGTKTTSKGCSEGSKGRSPFRDWARCEDDGNAIIEDEGVCTPGDGYGTGLMPGPSPKRKSDESVDSSPRASMTVKRHVPPPPIMRPSGQYESDDDTILKGPKVAQLLRAIIEMRKEHKRLSDQMVELSLKLKSVKDDYDTLRLGLCSKVNTLAKTIRKNDA
ncbi:hypothetical protein C2845_PM17G07160 [Panicum miliaceum]|uniref:Uncharacterized protein n=1 Tax=Panicum miliaceum TaxID=4540 RepID=A0A3L6Q180_PANMI|nr:hypothetical protein C2845_PM17G07160 [Panicum miliaceum]